MGETDGGRRASVLIAELLRRRDAGEDIDEQAVLARHPELARELREFFANEQVVQDLFDRVPEGRANLETSGPGGGDSVPSGVNKFDRLPVEFGRYRVHEILGQGAMGAVYLAHDTRLGRDVALKTPKLDVTADPELIERFEREARAAAALHHRNICPIFDVGEIDGVRFLTMAHIEGRPLSDLISKDRLLAEKQVANLVRKLALALDQAHQAGIVHRDLKPANVMIDREREPIVMDFGLARHGEAIDESRLTAVGTLMGSPAYMSPEQVSGDPQAVGSESDIYSLGVMLFELLTGKLPYEGSVAATIGQIIAAPVPTVGESRSGCDKTLEAICLKMMAKQKVERYASMNAVADDLGQFLKQSREAGATNSPAPPDKEPVAGHEGNAVAEPLSVSAGTQKDSARTHSDRVSVSTKHIALGLGAIAGLAIFAGVIIHFSNGTRVEIEDGTDATVKRESDGRTETLTIRTTSNNQEIGNKPDEPAATRLAADDSTVDLLALIDPDRDATTGDWIFEGDALVTPPVRGALLEIPYDPPEDYELTVVLEKVSGVNGFHMGLMVGGSQTVAAIDVGPGEGRITGLQPVDETSFQLNELSREHSGNLLQAGRQHTIVYKVCAAEGSQKQLIVTLNGATIIDWTGESSRLSNGEISAGRRADRLFLGDWETSFSITRLELQAIELGGEPVVASGSSDVDPANRTNTGVSLQSPQNGNQMDVKGSGQAIEPGTSAAEKNGNTDRAPKVVEITAVLTGHREWIRDLDFTADGRQLVSCSFDKTVRVWDLDSQRQLHSVSTPTRCTALAVSPDGRRAVAAGQGQTIVVVDLEDGTVVRKLNPGGTRNGRSYEGVAWSPDGSRIASACLDRSGRIWNVESGQLVHTFPIIAPSNGPCEIHYTADGNRLVIAPQGKPGRVQVLDARNGSEEMQIPINGEDSASADLAIAPDSTRFVSGTWNGSMILGDLEQGKTVSVIQVASGSRTSVKVCWSPDGGWIAGGHPNGTIYLVDAATLRVAHRIPQGLKPTALAFSSDSRRLAAAFTGNASGDLEILVFRIPTPG